MSARWVWWQHAGWRGWRDASAGVEPGVCLDPSESVPIRRSRHAQTVRLTAAGDVLYVKRYDAPAGWRASRASMMGRALAAAGLGAPASVLVGRRGGEGLLVTRDTGGEDIATALGARRAQRGAKRALLHRLGDEVGRLHAAGFVHGDLVAPNVHVVGDRLVFIDHDRTRRSRVLVALVGRRNLVQLGRLVVPGVTATDRARVLSSYAARRGLSARARHRLARWVMGKTIARRCAIDHIEPAVAARAGYRALMRSGGPFDPGVASGMPATEATP